MKLVFSQFQNLENWELIYITAHPRKQVILLKFPSFVDCESEPHNGFWDENNKLCYKFYVLKGICVLINAQSKTISKHLHATEKMGYGCSPGLTNPNKDFPERTDSPWPEGMYDVVPAKKGERKPETDFFTKIGELYVRDINDPWVCLLTECIIIDRLSDNI